MKMNIFSKAFMTLLLSLLLVSLFLVQHDSFTNDRPVFPIDDGLE